jgi:hypothetical protein
LGQERPQLCRVSIHSCQARAQHLLRGCKVGVQEEHLQLAIPQQLLQGEELASELVLAVVQAGQGCGGDLQPLQLLLHCHQPWMQQQRHQEQQEKRQ